jgi:hypothetical protein
MSYRDPIWQFWFISDEPIDRKWRGSTPRVNLERLPRCTYDEWPAVAPLASYIDNGVDARHGPANR